MCKIHTLAQARKKRKSNYFGFFTPSFQPAQDKVLCPQALYLQYNAESLVLADSWTSGLVLYLVALWSIFQLSFDVYLHIILFSSIWSRQYGVFLLGCFFLRKILSLWLLWMSNRLGLPIRGYSLARTALTFCLVSVGRRSSLRQW